MRKIHCADCGKSYDYDVDDFCPRCGSFNPPPDSGATRLEQELLSRFQRPGTEGRKQSGAAPYSYHPTYGSGPDLKKGRTHAASIRNCDACGPEKKRKKSGVRALVILLVVLAVLFVGAPLVEALVEHLVTSVSDLTDSFGAQEEVYSWTEAEEAPLPEGWYESYETIPLSNGQQVSVGDGWEPWLPDEVLEAHPGTRCLAVGLWVTGEPGGDYLPVLLVAEDGSSYMAEELSADVEEACGLDSISLADGRAEEEQFGYSFYFVPEDVTGQTLTVMILDETSISVPIGTEWLE